MEGPEAPSQRQRVETRHQRCAWNRLRLENQGFSLEAITLRSATNSREGLLSGTRQQAPPGTLPNTTGRARKHASRTLAVNPNRRTLRRWILMGGRGGASLRNCSSRSRSAFFMRLRDCEGMVTPRVAAKGLGDLIGGEIAHRPCIDSGRIGAGGEHKHHVRKVHSLAPGRGPDLAEGHDEVHLPVSIRMLEGLMSRWRARPPTACARGSGLRR